jgi:uncharacterized protein GlcG (DUF336 family)
MLSIPRLSLADARRLIEGAAGKAREIGVPMCIAVTDESGNLIAFERMDGAKIVSVTLAQNKAMTAAIARKPTADYNANCIPGNLTFGIHTALEGRFSIMGGGLPVFEGEQVVGAIGLSSGTPEQDIACAEAGLAHYSNGR